MRPAKVDQQDVGAALVEAFRTSGYAGASLRTLAQATGLKSASLYHRFPDGKAAMAATALAHAAERFHAQVVEPLAGDGPARARLRASAAGLRAFYADGGLACLLAIFSLSDAPPEVVAQVSAGFGGWIEALGKVLQDAGVAQHRDMAEDLIAAVQGALILARAERGRSAFHRAVVRMEGAAG